MFVAKVPPLQWVEPVARETALCEIVSLLSTVI